MPSQAPLQKINNLSSLLAQPAKQLTTQQQQLLQNPDFLQIIKQVMPQSFVTTGPPPPTPGTSRGYSKI